MTELSKSVSPVAALLNRRSVRFLIWALVVVFALVRYFFLRADFPNDSLWMIDQAKFTDEGWWSSGAVMQALSGHWYMPGDYNPAVAQPVWPLLLSVVFHFTGMSVVAARALNVSFSVATVIVVSLLVRRHAGQLSPALAPVGGLLLAASPFAYAFSRLAILDTLVAFEFCCLLLMASYRGRRRAPLLAGIALAATLVLLTKTTSVLLLPAVFWMLLRTIGWGWRRALAAAAACLLAPFALFEGWRKWVEHCGYGADYHYFYSVNALDPFDWSKIWQYLLTLATNGMLIDRVLYPVVIALLLIAPLPFWWRKQGFSWPHLLRNPLFASAALGFLAEAAFILRRGDDYAPRYFLVMLAPLVLMAVMIFAQLIERRSPLAWVVMASFALAVAMNGAMIADFQMNRSYQFADAAESIAKIVHSDSCRRPMIFGVSGSQLTLMTGIPSINDAYTLEEMPAKLRDYHPGWYLVWNVVADSDQELLAPYNLEEVASYTVFDDDERNLLILYRMTPTEK